MTGASSFTGMWFARELAKAGHTVITPLLHASQAYKETRKQRVEILQNHTQVIFECAFGSPQFMDLIDSQDELDMLCHHAADVVNYKSADFDAIKALEKNTWHLPKILKLLTEKNCRQIVLTGSIFEPSEGNGTDNLRAVSPYGLSKGLTSTYFEYYASLHAMKLGKFIIPNPFGPYEEERFTTFLMQTWASGSTATVTFPEYVRDNIHVSLLAKAYRWFVENLKKSESFIKLAPSEYVETQGEFAQHFAREMSQRLSLPCPLEFYEQTFFTEPKERYNRDKLDIKELQWNETQAWDELANYYRAKYLY